MKTVEQEQDLVAGRRELLASKSVSELSKVRAHRGDLREQKIKADMSKILS